MPLILHIDTALEKATISIASNGRVICSLTNDHQKDHASFLQPGIKRLLAEGDVKIDGLSAVSVTAGPGSYTGLRVGMASAKGLCYALQIPLILISTLEVLAISIIESSPQPAALLYCPMIDAGRMEVFMALFDEHLKQVIAPCALILQPGILDDFVQNKKVIFSGSGAGKFIKLSNNPNFIYINTTNLASALSLLSLKYFQQGAFADLLTAEPIYLKPFYTAAAVKKI